MDFIDYFGWYWEGAGMTCSTRAYQQRLKMNVVSFRFTRKALRRWGGSEGDPYV